MTASLSPEHEKLIDDATRAACNALDKGQPGPAVGHRFGYPVCVGPDCSCWAGRRGMIREALAAYGSGLARLLLLT